ncbi:DUF3572 domain-containing protein [Bartonella tamiae]|uniref:DUF3572 family protein n=1 Tax=Bartonella tamiae Th239 TaxID=1094558 RepID=J0QZL6_9HYPH|nr:DUF3572 domain-containing protein [Bartonella tamiae]EJF88689.1 hypothetical protein ME5_01240 [Bartonella tamiae Th239]EJF95061.1 hypothetical protein MEG_00642 [Bartonella tamiae Th307]
MKKDILNKEDAQELATLALLFIANDSELLQRFLNITGIAANDIRKAASTVGFHAGVLQFIAAHEPTLLEFAKKKSFSPNLIEKALLFLPGGEKIEWN